MRLPTIVTPATKTCERCGGSGHIPRERRKLADGSADPADYRREEICDKCGGFGASLM